MWTALGVISVIALFLFWKGRNAVWGGLTFGVVIGIVLTLANPILGNGFSLRPLGKAAVVGILLGLLAEMLGRAADAIRDRNPTKSQDLAQSLERQVLLDELSIVESFPLWWFDRPEIEDGLEGALNIFMKQYNLPRENESPEEAKLRILEQSGLEFDDPESTAMLDSYKMSLRLSGFADRIRSAKGVKPREA